MFDDKEIFHLIDAVFPEIPIDRIKESLRRLQEGESQKYAEYPVPPPIIISDPPTDDREDYPRVESTDTEPTRPPWSGYIGEDPESEWRVVYNPLAFYIPAHGDFPLSHGIYLLEERIAAVVHNLIDMTINDFKLPSGLDYLVSLVATNRFFEYLLAHEAGHRYSEAIWSMLLGNCNVGAKWQWDNEERFAQLYAFRTLSRSYKRLFDTEEAQNLHRKMMLDPGRAFTLSRPYPSQIIGECYQRGTKNAQLGKKTMSKGMEKVLVTFRNKIGLGWDSCLKRKSVRRCLPIIIGMADLVLVWGFIRFQPMPYHDWYSFKSPTMTSLGLPPKIMPIGIDGFLRYVRSNTGILLHALRTERRRWKRHGPLNGWSPFLLCDQYDQERRDSPLKPIARGIDMTLENTEITCEPHDAELLPIDRVPVKWYNG